MRKVFQPHENLNQNNKLGSCCKCPAMMSDGQIFTNWASSRIYNDDFMKALKIGDSNSYRELLQSTGGLLIKNEHKYQETNRCKSSDGKFYIDSSKYSFEYPLSDGYWGQQVLNHGIKKSEVKTL